MIRKPKYKILFFSVLFIYALLFCYSNGTKTKKKTLSENRSLSEQKTLTENSYLTENKHLTEEKFLTENEALTEGVSERIGAYAVTVEANKAGAVSNTVSDVFFDTEFEAYTNEYGKWLKLVIQNNQNARYQFARYFSDWQWSDQSSDFFSYSENRAEYERRIELCYDAAVKKFGIGTAIIATTWIVSFMLPGGSIYREAFVIIAKATTEQAIAGGAIGGLISLGTGFIQGKRGDELAYGTINGVADGYLVGSLTGFATGTSKVYKMANEIEKIRGEEIKSIWNGKVYDSKGNNIGKYKGEVTEINGRSIINKNLVGSTNENDIAYKYMLADDGNGNFFKIVNPDFSNIKIASKTYSPPKYLWGDTEATKKWCQDEYLKDLASPNVERILGISKKEACLRLQFEKGKDVLDSAFLKANNISRNEAKQFLKEYSGGAWHHLPESGKLIYVPKNHYQLAPHTGGDSFWGSKLTEESIEW
ncbi:MAG: hypothetical protein IJP61_12405 [Treponema sp.]|nr:hypothetical protein [Treponema sp.]